MAKNVVFKTLTAAAFPLIQGRAYVLGFQLMPEQMNEEIPDLNLFMVCEQLQHGSVSTLPDTFHFRKCREDELDIWKSMPFDNPGEAIEYQGFMTDYFNTVYADKKDLFYETCFFVCNAKDEPIATAFIWKAYDKFNSIHWLKVRKSYEDQGIGRALLSYLMARLKPGDYPVYLHTHPSSYRAIKLYSDFGYVFLSNPIIGHRSNDLEECLPILERHLPEEDFRKLNYSKADSKFLNLLKPIRHEEF